MGLFFVFFTVLRSYYLLKDDIDDSIDTFREKRRKPNVIKWNQEERMTNELALEVIEGIERFYYRLYWHPGMKPFNTLREYEGSLQVLKGLKEFIKNSANDNSKEIENAENIE